MTTQSGTKQAPLLLMIAGGAQVYREYLLRSISTRFRIHLFDVAEPTWEREYLTGWSVLDKAIDGPAMAQIAKTMHDRAPISGVICWYEGRIHLAARVAGELGLRNGDPAVIWRLRDKAQTRAALTTAGIAQPRSIPVKTLDEALAAAQSVGYPAILKPRGFGASLGVVRVDDVGQLRERFSFTRDTPWPEQLFYSTDKPILVEECVSGEEVSIDSVVQDGKVAPLFVARKVLGYPPFAEEIGHYVDAADPLLTDPDLLTALQDTHTALGFLDGWTHTEFMLSQTGPQLIEVNGRLGGDMIPYLGQLATGIDPGLAAACVACGLPPDITPSLRRVAGIRFFYVEHDDTAIASIGFDAQRLPTSIECVATVAKPGDTVSPPPKSIAYGRIAFAIAVGDSIPDCRNVLDAAEEALVVSSL
jgi:biotin carboxylase